jgi:uncharacterized iron-regulated membrane protein
MKRFRSILFWTHLASGLIAGISIAIMCFTGAALAFEGEISAWAERDARRITPPAADAPRLAIDDLIKKVREAQPETRPSGIVISPDPRDAVAFTLGREGALYVDHYTGEIRRPASTKVHDFLHALEDWHRVLAMGGDNRATGKLINGVCNIAFCVLAITGLYLWMPRSWSWRSVRGITLFNWKYTGKARDFNWHNVIGLWSAPILIVLTLTAIPISFRWGANVIYKIAGEQPPALQSGGSGGLAAGPAVEVPKPARGTRPLDYSALLAAVQKEIPHWELITFRLGTGRERGGAGGQSQRAASESASTQSPSSVPKVDSVGGVPPPREAATANPSSRAEGGERRSSENRGGTSEGRPAAQAISVTVKEPGSWPRTATTTLSLNPYTGDILKREGFADLVKSRQIRTWTRFLHTGQALGWFGQLVAGLACVGGCFLAYTGFALSWRRFFSKKNKPAPGSANGA